MPTDCRHTISICAILTWTLLPSHAALADNAWPGFRGPRATGSAAAPGTFGGGCQLELGWKKPLGSGYSGIAVGGGRVVTMFSDGKQDVVIAFDQDSGRELWRHGFAPTYEGHDGSHTGPIATPLIDSGRVFCLGPRGQWFAVDLDSGQPLWNTHLAEKYESTKPHYGFSTSPLAMDGVVVLQIGAKDAAVAGFDPQTGERLWTSGSDRIQYQSPIAYSIMGRQQVLGAGDSKLFGVDAKSGELLWEYEHQGEGARGVASLTPVPAGGQGPAQRLFLAYKDTSSTAIKLSPRPTEETLQPPKAGFDFESLWEDNTIRNSYNVPVYHEGHIYAYSSRFLTCVDAASGEARWRSRQPGDGFMILVDGHLVLATKEGGVHVAPATPDGYHEVAAIPQVFESELIWANPAFADGSVFVRSHGEIARIDIKRGPTGVAAAAPLAPERQLAATRFGRFLAELEGASDKSAVIERFLATSQFPVVEGEWVHFVYRGPGSDLAVAGDVIGARQERPMNRIDGTDMFYYSMKLEPSARSNYLFMRDYEEILDPRNPRKTTTMMLTKDMEMAFGGGDGGMEMSWFGMPRWEPPRHLDEPEPARRGKVVADEFTSKILVDRRPPWQPPPEDGADDEPKPAQIKLDVYLPHGYEQGGSRYPVAYIFGGAAAQDQGQLPTMLDNLAGRRVQPIIAVFIHRDPPFGGDPSEYLQMFDQELVAHVDQKYRTVAEPQARACVGMGFAGGSAFMAGFSSAQVGKIGCQGAFVMDSMMGPMGAIMKGPAEQPRQIYMDWGKYDMRNPHENWDLGDGNRRFAEMIASKGYTIAGGEAPDGCGWSSWQNRTDDLFETLFPM